MNFCIVGFFSIKQARRKHFEIGGAQYRYPFLGPYRPKYWGGPTICFTLFSPNIGGAQAPPAHTLPPGLYSSTN